MSAKIHVVETGDSLWKIAKHYGVNLQDIIKANPEIKDPNKIFPGDKIQIRGVEEEKAGGSRSEIYPRRKLFFGDACRLSGVRMTPG
jgi:spore coat assembly protein SafA